MTVRLVLESNTRRTFVKSKEYRDVHEEAKASRLKVLKPPGRGPRARLLFAFLPVPGRYRTGIVLDTRIRMTSRVSVSPRHAPLLRYSDPVA